MYSKPVNTEARAINNVYPIVIALEVIVHSINKKRDRTKAV